MRIIILGSSAGGGVPQWNCGCPYCREARQAGRGRTQSSVAVSADGERWVLLNASPDAVNVPGGRWDGRSYDTSIMFGANAPDGKGNVTGYFTYHQQDPVNFGTRDYAACQLGVTGAGVPFCTGSSNSNFFAASDGSFNGTYSVVGNQFNPRSDPPTYNSKPPSGAVTI